MTLTCLPEHFSCQPISSYTCNLMWHIAIINIAVRLNHNKFHATISIKITKQTFSSTCCRNINTSKYLCLFHFDLLYFVLASSLQKHYSCSFFNAPLPDSMVSLYNFFLRTVLLFCQQIYVL